VPCPSFFAFPLPSKPIRVASSDNQHESKPASYMSLYYQLELPYNNVMKKKSGAPREPAQLEFSLICKQAVQRLASCKASSHSSSHSFIFNVNSSLYATNVGNGRSSHRVRDSNLFRFLRFIQSVSQSLSQPASSVSK